MEKIKISVYNLYKNNINYNMIGGAGAATLVQATTTAKDIAGDNTAKAKMQLAIAQADLQQQLAQAKLAQANVTDAAQLNLAQAKLAQAKVTDAAQLNLAQAKLAEAIRAAKAREAETKQASKIQQERLELEKARLNAENYTLDQCRKDVKEYKFYNLRNQIEMNTLQTDYGKTQDQIKNLLKTNNFDFDQVKNQLQAEADAAAAKEAEEVGDAIAKLFTAEGKIVVKVHKLRK